MKCWALQERRVRERRPLIGRDDEWRTIQPVADQSLAGEGHAVTIVGDVGLGKSRLLEEVMAYWTEPGRLSLSATCPSFGRHTPYLPWLDLLRALFGFNPADPSPVKLDKIATVLQAADPGLARLDDADRSADGLRCRGNATWFARSTLRRASGPFSVL